MSWSKAEAYLNMNCIVVTPEVSHALMSSSKDHFPENNNSMSVTPEVSHVEMWPYVASAAARSENQRATAVLMVLSSATMSSKEGKKMGRVLRAPESKKCAKACWWNETNAELVN